MGAAPAAFFLMLIGQGAGTFSMHMVAPYSSRAECVAAQQAVGKALAPAKGPLFACISEESLGALQDANR